MSTLPDLTLTNAGLALLAKTPLGSPIPVTKWQIGTGYLPDGTDVPDRTELVAALLDRPIASAAPDGNQVLITGQLVNTNLQAFTWRETGLFATDPDVGEILYAYGNAGDNGVDIPDGNVQFREIEFGTELVFDTAANVTAVISKTLVFATLDDLDRIQAAAVETAVNQIANQIISGSVATALTADNDAELTTDDGIQLDAVRFL